jgi:hypothetical protein
MSMTNAFDMRCPNCGAEDCIDIQARLWVHVTDDGTDPDASDNGNHEWTQDSPALCTACGYCWRVRDFEPESNPGSANS